MPGTEYRILNTSLRSRTLPETLSIAKTYAHKCGISRVTNVTRLDKLGIPVYAGIRPSAELGSLCVSAGKGLWPAEAQVSAYMEAIEFAIAEPRHSNLSIISATYADVLSSETGKPTILDLCPAAGAEIPLGEQVSCVTTTDLISGKPMLAPAELVFVPFRNRESKNNYFGNNTNGLASGNNLPEACIHGILEVLERDVLSFQHLEDTSRLVAPDSWPEKVKAIGARARQAGLELSVRTTENEYGLAFFSAILIDRVFRHPLYVNSGYACHPDKNIAILRAVTEAAQSRLSFIHGGRDDLFEEYQLFQEMTAGEQQDLFEQLSAAALQDQGVIHFENIPDVKWPAPDLSAYLEQLMEYLQNKGVESILMAAHTCPEEPIQVVKVIIPGLEFFTTGNPRIGPRLKAYAEKIVGRTLRGPLSDG